ncbi:EAL domain-containing protein [Methyloversatilis sp.]|uniref:bifunctional diguanylate cyclase/phosphodiesterase n=1 Tax=Methyloversatilis sp. TaxID=2569862 RepID=UPI002736115C|nr:EAL domain-containing protein [Methyloversatilis sp.]MDP3577769.1 EAL domain-containing protein [Methyloversatilis sp.]
MLYLALLGAGLAGNYLKYPIFLNVEFLFGSIFSILALQFFGTARGVLAALLISSVTWWIWRHPYAIVIMTAELWFAAVLMQRLRISLVLAVSVYWLLIGMPLVYLFYHQVMNLALDSALVTMAKQAVNGISNALLARLIYTGYARYSGRVLVTFREVLQNAFVLAVLTPMLLLLAYDSSHELKNAQESARMDLGQESQRLSGQLDLWVHNRTLAVTTLAEVAAMEAPALMQRRLEQARASDPNFLRLGLLDANFRTSAYSPPRDASGKSAIGVDFSDRPYYPVLRQTLRPMLSEVVQGRLGPTPNPITVILAPVLVQGRYQGAVAGVLNLGQLAELINNDTAEKQILYTLIDKNGAVILSNRPDQAAGKPYVRGPGELTRLDERVSQWMPELPNTRHLYDRWRQSTYVSETWVGDLAEWRLLLEQPIAPIQRMLSQSAAKRMGLLLAMLLLAALVAELFSRRIAATIESLREITLDLPAKLAAGSAVTWPRGSMIETNTLVTNLQAMADSLTAEFKRTRLLNESLEERVAERTRALEKLNRDFSTLLDNTTDQLFSKDAQSRMLFCSQSMAKSLGHDSWRELIGKSTGEIFTAEEGRVVDAEDQRVMATGQPLLEQPRQRRNGQGELRWVSTSKWPILDAEGRAVGLFGIHRDITQSKQAQEELLIAATAFESQEGIFVTDASRVILKVNRAFTEITGYAAADAVGAQPDLLLPSNQHDEAFMRELWNSVAKDASWHGELRVRCKDGSVHPQWLTITSVHSPDGTVVNYVGTLVDITERKAAEDEIRNLAFYDPLTQLPNRRLMLDRLQQAVAARARSGVEGALLFIDLDHFKNINDARGHAVGDQLLQQVAQRLQAMFRAEDTVARLGGDEFVVLITELAPEVADSARLAMRIAEKVRDELRRSIEIDGRSYRCSASIGVTLIDKAGQTSSDLLREADTAMYRAKEAGRNQVAFFEAAMQAVVEKRIATEEALSHALARNELRMVLQPQFDRHGQATGAELLMRWHHPALGHVPPSEFIPLAEEMGLIVELGEWALKQACLTSVRLQALGKATPISVNVSPRQFRQTDFVQRVAAILAENQAQASEIILEVTEGMLIEDVDGAIARMQELVALGIRFSIDDFGTGYSSLNYLKRMPLYELKIDKSFIDGAPADPTDTAIVKLIFSVAVSLGLKLVAEGVETRSQSDFLVEHGCDAMQGYYLARPMPIEDWLARQAAPLDGTVIQ